MPVTIGEKLKDRYLIESILGEGGMGTVYRAQDTLFDRPRAIKELYPDPLADEAKLHASRLQFEQEAQALKKLRHRNLPHVSDYFSVDENDYLVMDYIEGESISEILARKQRPTEELVYNWLVQILDALRYCHAEGVLHRDIKPANIVLTPEGRVMLVDFSLVKIFDPHNPRTATIVRGLGTPQYTPLEQYDASAGHTDERSDIYALGATLYHMLTGHPPQPVSQRILNPDTQPPIQRLNPNVSPWMAKYVQKAMTIQPGDRYQNVNEMRQELETRLFKLRTQPKASVSSPDATRGTYRRGGDSPPTSARASAPSKRLARRAPREDRHARYKVLKSSDWYRVRRSLVRNAPKTLKVVWPALVPISVVMVLTMLVALLFASGSTLLVVAVITPLVVGGLIFKGLFSGRNRGPPKF
jgi:serine/threonine-protein kinase